MARRLRADLAARDVALQPQRGPRARRPPVRRARLEHPRRPATRRPDGRRTRPEAGPAVPILRIFDRGQGRRVLRRLPRLRPSTGSTADRPTTPRSTPRSPAGRRPAPERAPRRRQPRRRGADPGRRSSMPCTPSSARRDYDYARPGHPRRGLGPGDGGGRPVPQPARLPPAGHGERRAAAVRGGRADRAHLRPRLLAGAAPSTRSPGASTSGGTRLRARGAGPGGDRPPWWASAARCTWPTARRTSGATVTVVGPAPPLRPDVHARPGPRAPEHAGGPVRAVAAGAARASFAHGGWTAGQRRGPVAVHRVEHPARPVRCGRRGTAGARRPDLGDRGRSGLASGA